MPEARCDIVLLSWTVFISFNLLTDHFWNSGNDANNLDDSLAAGMHDVYTGRYKLESNESMLEEGLVRLTVGSKLTSVSSVRLGTISLAFMPEDARHSYRSMNPDLTFAGVEMDTVGRMAATATSDEKLFSRFGQRKCNLDASFQLAGLQVSNDGFAERQIADIVTGKVLAVDCGLQIHLESQLINVNDVSSRVVHYSVWVNLLSIFQIRSFLSQMKHTQEGNAAVKVSMIAIAMQASLDAFDSFLHICLAFSSQYMFNTIAIIALFKFMFFSFLEARYLLFILRHRRHEAFSEGWDAIRREVSWLYSRFYGALVVGLLLVYHGLDRLDLLVLLLQAYWVPQIAWDAWQGTRNSMHQSYVVGTSATRTAMVLYLWGCPDTIFNGKIYPRLPGAPNANFCALIVALQAVQVTVLLLQTRWGPRWFVPWVFMPWAYNYQRFASMEAGTDCVICMLELDQEDGLQVVTPCNHHFHKACVEKWMEIKMECPTCRTTLPPLLC